MTYKRPFRLMQSIENMTKKYITSRIILVVIESRTRERWFPPLRGSIKINVDAAFCSSSREASFEAVARKKEAEVFFLIVTKIQGYESSLQV